MSEKKISDVWIFEPHNGFGENDFDGDPWPFGYISDGSGAVYPIFSLEPILDLPADELRSVALKMAAAGELYKAAQRALNVLKAQGESVRPGSVLGALDSALRKARGEASA